MSAEQYLIGSYGQVGRLVLMLKGMTFVPGRHLKVSLEWIDPRGTDAQRVKIRAMVGQLAKHAGYSAEDLYEILLAHRFGTKTCEVLKGCKIERPARRVSDLKKEERSAYIDWLHELGSSMGAW